MKIDPSLRRFGAVAIAALMLGTAPAALFAATPDDTLVIAAAIDDMLAHRERWPAMRAAGRHFVEDVRNWTNSVAKYRAVYERLAAPARARKTA